MKSEGIITEREAAEYPSRDDSHIIDALMDLYGEERTRFYASMNEVFLLPKDKEGKPRYLTRKYVAYHIYYRWAVSTVGSREGSRWTTFDVDSGGWEMAKKVIRALCDIGIPYNRIYVSSSGGKGYHVEIFYDQIIYYELQKKLYHEVLKLTEATEKEIELRPTCTQSIKIPLGKHYKTRNICWYLDKETGAPIQSREYVTTIQKMPAAEVRELIWALEEEEEEEASETGAYWETDPEVDSALQTLDITKLPQIAEPGTRHITVMRIAFAMFNKGFSHDDTERLLLEWYELQDKNNTETYYDEAIDDVHSIVDWVYEKMTRVGNLYKNKYVITRWDIERVLEQNGVAARGTFFNILAWSKAKGYARCTERIIAKQVGITNSMVHKTMKKMQDEDQIRVQVGRRHHDSGGYWCERSTIWIRQGISDLAIPDDKVKAPLTEISVRDVAHDFWRVYFDTLFAIADREWVMKRLCKREKELLAEVEKKGIKENGTQNTPEEVRA